MGTTTVLVPVAAPKSPVCVTVTVTDSGDAGAGAAVRVKDALWPSVTPVPAVTLTSGVAGGGGGSSSSATSTVAAPWDEDTV